MPGVTLTANRGRGIMMCDCQRLVILWLAAAAAPFQPRPLRRGTSGTGGVPAKRPRRSTPAAVRRDESCAHVVEYRALCYEPCYSSFTSIRASLGWSPNASSLHRVERGGECA